MTTNFPSTPGAEDLSDSKGVSVDSKGKAQTKDLPDVALKWGVTPGSQSSQNKQNGQDAPDWENYYTEEEKEKLRKKGINPALKAEMDASRKGSGGFWSRVAGTAWGGGVIK